MEAFLDNNSKMAEMAEFFLDKVETLWEKGEVLVTSIFSISYNVFKFCFFEGHFYPGLFGKGYKLSSLMVHSRSKHRS